MYRQGIFLSDLLHIFKDIRHVTKYGNYTYNYEDLLTACSVSGTTCFEFIKSFIFHITLQSNRIYYYYYPHYYYLHLRTASPKDAESEDG